jgi:hypothetical protein
VTRLPAIFCLLLLPAWAATQDPPKPHLPNPPTPNCQCGCTETGRCMCKDCDHPALEKPRVDPTRSPKRLTRHLSLRHRLQPLRLPLRSP